MAWVKIDDQFSENPKVVLVGPLGMAMQVAALCYCNRNLTDGFIPRGKVPGLIDLTGFDVTWEQIVETLCTGEKPLWEVEQGGYRIHDYLDFQPSRADVERERQEARDRMAAIRSRKGQCSDEVRPNITRSSHCPVPVPVPDNLETTPLPPQGGAAVSPDRIGRKRGETDPRIQMVIGYYRRLFKARFGQEPFIKKKDGRIIEQLLTTYSPERLWNMLQAYMTDEEPYIKRSGHSLSLFMDQINKYVLGESVHELYRTQTIRAPSTPEAIRRVLEAEPGGDVTCLTN